MASKSVEELCDELLKSKVFHCTKCAYLLQPPVMTVPEHGNVCYKCCQKYYKTLESSTLNTSSDCSDSVPSDTSSNSLCSATPNRDLDSLLKEVDFACNYEYCSDRITCNEYYAHVEYCRYKIITCEVGGCPWKGMRKTYIDHYVEYHEVNVIARDVDNIVGLKENNLKTDILQTSCGTFVLHVMLTKDNYNFVICDIGHTPNQTDFKVFIKFSEGSKTYTVESNIVQSNKILGFVDSVATQINREALRVFFPKKLNIIWELKVDNELDVAHDMLSELFIAEINTSKNVTEKAQNTLLSRVRHPCVFSEKGCKVKCFLTVDHESTCSHYSWQCFLCLNPVNFTDFHEHFYSMHLNRYSIKTDVCVYNYSCQTKVKRYVRRAFQRYFVIEHQCDIIHNKTHNCKWSVNHIGPKDNRFVFEVEVFYKTCPWKSVILRNECHYNGESPEWCQINRSVFDYLGTHSGPYDYCVRLKPYRQSFL